MARTMASANRFTAVSEPTNGAARSIALDEPYRVHVTIQGASDILFHCWNCEERDKPKTKGGKASKTDNVESYVRRLENQRIGLPGEYLRQSIIHAAKFKSDPRSPRKSAMDLYKAGIVCVTDLADLGKDRWDYEHKCRVTVQRAGINRTRPAFKVGWKAEFDFEILLPEYITPELFHETLSMAGRVVGVADFRPTYGRFNVVGFETSRG